MYKMNKEKFKAVYNLHINSFTKFHPGHLSLLENLQQPHHEV